jgi:hypothetical protein
MCQGPPLVPLRVKFGLLGLHLCYQFLDPIHRNLIGNQETYTLVMFDLFVEALTLFTHAEYRIRALAVKMGC